MYIFQSLKMIVFIALLITGAFTAAGAEAVSDQEREETVPTAFQQLIQSRNLLGNYGGSRSAMEDQGIFLSAYYNYFFGYKANGGQEPGQTKRHSGSLDTYLLADFEEMKLIPGGELLLHMKLNHGRNVNPHVGALSDPFDDADFSKGVYIGQFWYQQGFLDQKCRFRFGYLSMGTILDRNAYANSEDKQFFSTYLDNNNATILLKDSIGAALFLNPANWWEMVIGVADAENKIRNAGFDTAFDDWKSVLVYFETGFSLTLKSERGALPGKYLFGLLYDPTVKAEFGQTDPTTGDLEYNRGDTGFYFNASQLLFKETREEDQGLGVFFRYGYRDREVNKINHFWSAGVQYQGMLPQRNKDILGIGFYSAHASNNYQRTVNSDFTRETGIECYYNIILTQWCSVAPDVQFIDNPGGLRTAEDALVFGFRMRISF